LTAAPGVGEDRHAGQEDGRCHQLFEALAPARALGRWLRVCDAASDPARDLRERGLPLDGGVAAHDLVAGGAEVRDLMRRRGSAGPRAGGRGH
jgi:hypothetical protein